MNYHSYEAPMMQSRRLIENTTLTEPYFIEVLEMIKGKSVVVETVRGNSQGILADVKPDHIVLKSYDNDTVFYIRLKQIVEVMPINYREVAPEQLFD